MSRIRIFLTDDGDLVTTYNDSLAHGLTEKAGSSDIRRASHVEPDEDGSWYVDLTPSGGPVIRGFDTRGAALEYEIDWLNSNLGQIPDVIFT